MLDCTTEKYDDLYDRWLDKPGALLDWAKFDSTKDVLLDLCGGTGAVAKDALRRGAEQVWLLDLNPRVKDSRIVCLRGRAEHLTTGPYDPLAPCEDDDPLDVRGPPLWNLVVCRQALGYLDLPVVVKNLWHAIEPGGRFVFNTFARPKFSLKTYRRTSSEWTRRYFEASAFFGRRVFHFQARVGGGFDFTAFRWWTDADILKAFQEGWKLVSYKESSTTLWYSFERVETPPGPGK